MWNIFKRKKQIRDKDKPTSWKKTILKAILFFSFGFMSLIGARYHTACINEGDCEGQKRASRKSITYKTFADSRSIMIASFFGLFAALTSIKVDRYGE